MNENRNTKTLIERFSKAKPNQNGKKKKMNEILILVLLRFFTHPLAPPRSNVRCTERMEKLLFSLNICIQNSIISIYAKEKNNNFLFLWFYVQGKSQYMLDDKEMKNSFKEIIK